MPLITWKRIKKCIRMNCHHIFQCIRLYGKVAHHHPNKFCRGENVEMLLALASISKSPSAVLRASSTRYSSFFPFFHWHIPFFLLTLTLRGFTNDILICKRISASKKSCQVTLELLFLYLILLYSRIQLRSSNLHIYFLNEINTFTWT